MPHPNEISENTAVSEQTPIRLSLVLGILSFAVLLISAAWYLSSSLSKIEIKLDSISTQLTATASTAALLERRLSDHERDSMNTMAKLEGRISVIEKSGSDKTRDIERSVTDLANAFKVHEALSHLQPIPLPKP